MDSTHRIGRCGEPIGDQRCFLPHRHDGPHEKWTERWMVEPTSCADGGRFAWLRYRDSGAWEMIGCVCHHNPPKHATVVLYG